MLQLTLFPQSVISSVNSDAGTVRSPQIWSSHRSRRLLVERAGKVTSDRQYLQLSPLLSRRTRQHRGHSYDLEEILALMEFYRCSCPEYAGAEWQGRICVRCPAPIATALQVVRAVCILSHPIPNTNNAPSAQIILPQKQARCSACLHPMLLFPCNTEGETVLTHQATPDCVMDIYVMPSLHCCCNFIQSASSL